MFEILGEQSPQALISGVLATLLFASTPGYGMVRYVSNSTDSVTDLVLVAHEDDWQLFMGDVLTERRQVATRTVFVYLTAGDDGRDSTYWRTRERAALASTRLEIAEADDPGQNCRFTSVASHDVWRCGTGRLESYFLRLPDGRRNGRGFSVHRFESLWKVRRNKNAPISAIDGSATYSGWADLVNTIAAIVGDSSRSPVEVHANDPSVAINPHDHTDHRVAGLLAEQLRKDRHWLASYYVGYALAARADNLSTKRRQMKTSLFLEYDREMTRAGKNWSAYREHPKFYTQCMARTYRRSPRPRL